MSYRVSALPGGDLAPPTHTAASIREWHNVDCPGGRNATFRTVQSSTEPSSVNTSELHEQSQWQGACQRRETIQAAAD